MEIKFCSCNRRILTVGELQTNQKCALCQQQIDYAKIKEHTKEFAEKFWKLGKEVDEKIIQEKGEWR